MDVLRLDLLHPVVSGNKWFKLQYYLQQAKTSGKKIILTFGGAYSNHIVATAAAAREWGFRSIGIIRGEAPPALSPTLQEAQRYGMQLVFISRDAYREKQVPPPVFEEYAETDVYVIPEGGSGEPGVQGAATILDLAGKDYSHIVAAAGTGTTAAGLVRAATHTQEVIAVSVLKNHFSLQKEMEKWIAPVKRKQLRLLHEYHFGGYAKKTGELVAFMNTFYRHTGIPTDFVYTAKLFFAVNDLLQKNDFPGGSRILVIHSGGLQGNRSLGKGTLIF